MSLKIKPSRVKKRRRGSRLIVQDGETREVYVPGGDGMMRLVEMTGPDETIRVLKRTPQLVMLHVVRPGKPDLEVVHASDQAEAVAQRFATDDCPWFFRQDGCYYISASETGMLNKALILSIVVKNNTNTQLPHELADFVGVSALLCDLDEVLSVHDNPRFAELRNFDFQVDDLPPHLGRGRRAENKARHEHSNYDEMLRKCAPGGLLFPEQYDIVRKGVDMLVTAAMKTREDV